MAQASLPADVLDQLAGEGVARGRGLVDVAGGEPWSRGRRRRGVAVEAAVGAAACAAWACLGCPPGDGRAGHERLEAAALTAGADRAVGVDDGVADLAGEAAGAAVEPAVEDDAGRDPGPDREVRDVVRRAEDAAPVQADGGGTGVVLDDARAAEACAPARRAGPGRSSRG